MLFKRLISYLVYGVGLLAVLGVPGMLRLLTDWYWFQEIGFSNIFTTILSAKIFLGLTVGILSFVVIYGNLWLARKFVVSRPMIIRLRESPAPYLSQTVPVGTGRDGDGAGRSLRDGIWLVV